MFYFKNLARMWETWVQSMCPEDPLEMKTSTHSSIGDCSHEIKRCLHLGRKVMTNLDSILKSRDIYFPNKGLSSQSYGFSSSHIWM